VLSDLKSKPPTTRSAAYSQVRGALCLASLRCGPTSHIVTPRSAPINVVRSLEGQYADVHTLPLLLPAAD
jgi:hypothetical protein